jgi:hypothetical protein
VHYALWKGAIRVKKRNDPQRMQKIAAAVLAVVLVVALVISLLSSAFIYI